MGLYKNKCSPVPVFILHNKLFQVKWARIPGSEGKIPVFFKKTGIFFNQLRQRPTGPAATTIWHTTTGSKVSRQAHHTAKEKASADFPRRLCSNTYFIKNFCRSASVVSSPMVISSVPVRRANIAISSLVSADDTEVIAHIYHGYLNTISGYAIEDQAGRIFFSADSKRDHVNFRFGCCKCNRYLQHKNRRFTGHFVTI